MPYKELTIDYVLGHCLTLAGQTWRVLEIDPVTGAMRTLLCADGTVRGRFDWWTVRAMIAEGLIYVE